MKPQPIAEKKTTIHTIKGIEWNCFRLSRMKIGVDSKMPAAITVHPNDKISIKKPSSDRVGQSGPNISLSLVNADHLKKS